MASRRLLKALPSLLSCSRSTLLRTEFQALKPTGILYRKDYWRWYSTDPCYDQEVVSLPCVKKLLSKSNIQLFDVRSHDEIIETGKIPGATNIPLDEVQDAFKLTPDEFESKYELSKPGLDDENITFHCRSGVRAQKAIEIIQELGYKKTHNFTGGWLEWQKAMEADLAAMEEKTQSG